MLSLDLTRPVVLLDIVVVAAGALGVGVWVTLWSKVKLWHKSAQLLEELQELVHFLERDLEAHDLRLVQETEARMVAEMVGTLVDIRHVKADEIERFVDRLTKPLILSALEEKEEDR